ncbi:FecR family protein [Marinifilum sp. D714]|uniref:FecR family protein n=1 Tax=Marinifilum sp. D714 TaxID=2937523 RepID=UPI0027CDA643|nr:FecR family protein [Marinifilum sp. D714]MDQ2178473.1 FecR domain-containing protein [Marinifilum sp. D714]
MKHDHKRIEEVFQILRNPKEMQVDFLMKYKDNPQMIELYEELRKYKEAGFLLEQTDEPNVGLEWQKLKNKLQNKKKYRINLTIAASIAVLIACAFALFFEKTSWEQEEYIVRSNRIVKGGSKAVLITSNGNEYELEKLKDLVISEKQGIQIITDSDNLIQYCEDQKTKELESEEPIYNTLKVPRLGEYELVLSDGSKVHLNSESELKYPVKFSGEERIVELIGEAYFDVTSNAEIPFVVRTNRVDTRVLGTKFNVNAYPAEDMDVTLVEGKVELYSKKKLNKIVLQPGENALLQTGGSKMQVSSVDVRKFTAWRDGYFYFEKERLEDIFIKLERWYDFKVFYQNPGVKDYEFRMRADRDAEFQDIAKRLEKTGRISIQISGNAVIVSDVNR